MQLDNATHSLQFQDQNRPATYMINTSKALKGSKLKTKDFIRVQLMKFKHTSPIQFNEAIEQKNINTTKVTEYQKFKPFDTIQEEDIHQIISLQRQKMSRETKGRIKLFENTKINSMCFDQNGHLPSATLQVRTKPATSLQSRASRQKPLNNKNISQHFSKTISFEKKSKTAQLIFKTENLGVKMNSLLNIYLNQQKKTGRKQQQQTEESRFNECQLSLFFGNNLPVRKKNNVTFMRQFKKLRRQKMEQKSFQILNRFNSEQVTQHLTAEISHRQRTAKLQSRKNLPSNNYSVQVRKRGSRVDFKHSMAKRQQTQNDSIFQHRIN